MKASLTFTTFLAAWFLHAQNPAIRIPESPVPTAPAAALNAPGEPGKPPRATRRSGATTYSATTRADSIPPVVVRFSPVDPQANAALEQDIAVMARVLSRTLERADAEKLNYKMGVPLLLTGAGKSVRPMYIEGTGPLFMIKVSFPVTLAAKTEPRPAPEETEDSEWEQAERDVYGDGEEPAEDRPSNFKQEQVDLLKRELLAAMKNATHIRNLGSNEFVNVVVFGQPLSSRSSPRDSAAEAKGTVLTLRARKADIDSFAAGKLDEGAFRTRVTANSYYGSGAGLTSINSWLLENARTLR
jgi:hypothetical protein